MSIGSGGLLQGSSTLESMIETRRCQRLSEAPKQPAMRKHSLYAPSKSTRQGTDGEEVGI